MTSLGPGAPDPWSTTDPAESRRQASWALALAVLPLVATQVAAFVLAALVVTERDRQPRRKPVAWTALAVATAWVVAGGAALVVLLASLSSDDDRAVIEPSATWNEDGSLDRPGRAGADDLRVGDCFDFDGPTGSRKVVVLPCSSPHTAEVHHVLTLPDGDYPGQEDVVRRARAGCHLAFEPWVGIPYADSDLT